MNDNIGKIRNMYWADASLDKVEINYENIDVYISLDIGVDIIIRCKNHIGILYLGHWDENIINSIDIVKESELVNETILNIKKKYGESLIKGGGTRDYNSSWFQMNINLIDNNTIEILCNDFELIEN